MNYFCSSVERATAAAAAATLNREMHRCTRELSNPRVVSRTRVFNRLGLASIPRR